MLEGWWLWTELEAAVGTFSSNHWSHKKNQEDINYCIIHIPIFYFYSFFGYSSDTNFVTPSFLKRIYDLVSSSMVDQNLLHYYYYYHYHYYYYYWYFRNICFCFTTSHFSIFLLGSLIRDYFWFRESLQITEPCDLTLHNFSIAAAWTAGLFQV